MMRQAAAHLSDLAKAASAGALSRKRPAPKGMSPVIQQILDAITDAPAWVRNARHDMLAANRMARARFVYLDPASQDFSTQKRGAIPMTRR